MLLAPLPVDDARDYDDSEPSVDALTDRLGRYAGVVPGENRANPSATSDAIGRPVVTWVGFQRLDTGSARVFVQLGAPVPFDQRIDGDALVIWLAGATLSTRNDARPLDTRFFGTRVARISAKAVRPRGRGTQLQPGGVELRVRFKAGAPALAEANCESGPDGLSYLMLELAP